MRKAIAGGLAGAAALALVAVQARMPATHRATPAPVSTPSPAETSLSTAIAYLAGDAPIGRDDYVAAALEQPFRPVPEPGSGALVALGLAALWALARRESACHPAR
jgi:PEP-CTERM motif